jgi:hypothetical protein
MMSLLRRSKESKSMRCSEHSDVAWGRLAGWALDPHYLNEVCQQCGNTGIVIGIGNREIRCDERCERCGKPAHETVVQKRI